MIGMSKKDFDKIVYFAKASVQKYNGAEIGGMAILQKNEEDDWIIKHPTILKQEVDGATCTLDKEALANYYTQSMMKHGTDIKFVWWHSHGTGSVFWSGTDETAIKEFSKSNWSVSLVVNADAEYRLRIDWWKPVPAKLDKVEMEIDGTTKVKIPVGIMKQVEKHVTMNTSIVTTGQTTVWNNKGVNHYGYGGYTNGSYTGYVGSVRSHWQRFQMLDTTLNYWQKKAIEDTDIELKAYADGSLSYLDLKGHIEKANNQLLAVGKIILPREKRLHKLVDDKANLDTLKYFKEG